MIKSASPTLNQSEPSVIEPAYSAGINRKGALVALVVLGLMLLIQPALSFTYSPVQLKSILEDGRSHGFYDPEKDTSGTNFIWTQENSYILLDYHTVKPLELTFEIRSAAIAGGPDVPVRVIANGQEVGQLRPDPKNNQFQSITLKFTPPKTSPDQRQLKVELVSNGFQPPKDRRVLGTMLKSVTINKSEAWAPVESKIWLLWMGAGLLVMALIFSTLSSHFRLAITSYGTIASSILGAVVMALLFFLVLRAGALDWATYPLWLLGSFSTFAFFTFSALTLPLERPGRPGRSIVNLIASRLRFSAEPWRKISPWKVREGRFWHSVREPLVYWLIWRLALFLGPVYAGLSFTFDDASPLRPFSPDIWMERLVWSWTRWDGLRYLDIAANGFYNKELINFYPLYPHLIRWVGFVLGFGTTSYAVLSVAGILVSALAALVSCIMLFKLACHEYDQETGRLSIIYLLAYPVSFFLGALLTESLFLALVVGAFYAARKERWGIAMLLAALTILCKNQGVIVVAALLIEYAHQRGWNVRRIDRRILYCVLPVFSVAGWLGFNWLAFGNPTQFLLAAQQYWGHTNFTWPWETLANAANRFFQMRDSGTWLPTGKGDPLFIEFPITVGFLILGVLAVWATCRGWFRPAYLSFFLCCLIQPLIYPVPNNELISMPRYLLIIFPAFMLLGLIGKRWRNFHFAYLAICLPLLGLLLGRFALWYWVA